MKCILIGNLKDSGYVGEVLEERGIDLFSAGEIDHVEKTINPVVESQADIAVFDLLALQDPPMEIVSTVESIQRSRDGKKIIFLAAGAGKNTPIVEALIRAGYTNFVLQPTYGEQKEIFARCLTNYYESNSDNLEKELNSVDSPRKLTFIAFAGAQNRIGTTTQALQYAGYLTDCGLKACYVEQNGDGLAGSILEMYQYAREVGDCVIYAGIPMYTKKSMQEMVKMNYAYFVMDMGCIAGPDFNASLFIHENVKRVIVAGAKPQEWRYTRRVLSNASCADASFIFSFVSQEDMNAVSGMFETSPLFAGYIPDPFARDQRDLGTGYRILPALDVRTKNKSRKPEGKGNRERRRL